jgi:hypothetical protein
MLQRQRPGSSSLFNASQEVAIEKRRARYDQLGTHACNIDDAALAYPMGRAPCIVRKLLSSGLLKLRYLEASKRGGVSFTLIGGKARDCCCLEGPLGQAKILAYADIQSLPCEMIRTPLDHQEQRSNSG